MLNSNKAYTPIGGAAVSKEQMTGQWGDLDQLGQILINAVLIQGLIG